MKCRRRTRRHPDKWKQRAHMRQVVRQWNDEKLIATISAIDFPTFVEDFVAAFKEAVQEITDYYRVSVEHFADKIEQINAGILTL